MMIALRRFLALAIPLALLATALSSDALAKKKPQKSLSCPVVYRNYFAKKPGHKAFATTGGRSIRSVPLGCGVGYAYPTKKAAIRRALQECAIARKRVKALAKCKVIEVR